MGNTNGFISLNRQLLEWEWHDDPTVLSVWVHLLLLAQWADSEWHGIEVKRGSLITSHKQLAVKTGLTEKQVRTALAKLKSTGEICSNRAGKGQIVTIEKYSLYQDGNIDKGRNKDTKGAGQGQHNNKNKNTITPLSKDKGVSGKPKKGRALTDTCKAVVTHLNEQTGSKYKTNAKYIRDLIGARLADGYTLEDFITVIDRQVYKWGNDAKMREYLRPQTLFRPANFDSYLNAPATEAEIKKEKAKEQREYDKAQLKIEESKLKRLGEYLNGDPQNKELLKAYREQKSKVDWLKERGA